MKYVEPLFRPPTEADRRLTAVRTMPAVSAGCIRLEELQELRRLKLNTLYVGLESGDQDILELVNKQEKVQDMIGI